MKTNQSVGNVQGRNRTDLPDDGAVVVGIDSSLTKTGVGVISRRGTALGIQLAHRRPVPAAKRAKAGLPPSPSLAERDDCLCELVEEVAEAVGLPDLVVVYGVPYHGKLAGVIRVDTPASWSRLVSRLLHNGLPVAVVTDTVARKAITGPRPKGESRESSKLATGLAVAKLYPDVEIVSDDVADALAAAHLGAVALGWEVPTLARHRDVRWSEWPAELAVAETAGEGAA